MGRLDSTHDGDSGNDGERDGWRKGSPLSLVLSFTRVSHFLSLALSLSRGRVCAWSNVLGVAPGPDQAVAGASISAGGGWRYGTVLGGEWKSFIASSKMAFSQSCM